MFQMTDISNFVYVFVIFCDRQILLKKRFHVYNIIKFVSEHQLQQQKVYATMLL